mgnify:FL=1|jgi:hypothetical protein
MKKKNVTIDDLAIMINKGFDDVTKEMRSGFQQNDRRFDKIESLMLVEHRTRIERLEKKVERLEGLLAAR